MISDFSNEGDMDVMLSISLESPYKAPRSFNFYTILIVLRRSRSGPQGMKFLSTLYATLVAFKINL